MNQKIVALDIGDVRIGIAVSDASRLIAQPLQVYKRIGYGPDVKHISEICRHHETNWILCGLPKNMDGTLGSQAEKTINFAKQLSLHGLKVFFQDERMTTLVAEKALIEGNMKRDRRKDTVDKVAAAVILQQWLDLGQEPRDYFVKEEEKMEIQNNIVELIDENNEEVSFEHLMTVEHEEDYYIILVPVDEGEEEEEEVVILKVDQDDQGEDCYVTVDDDQVLQTVFEKFIAILEEEEEYGSYDDEEEEDENPMN